MSHHAAEDAIQRYSRVRATTEALVEGLSPEDCCAQAFTEASPAKWHLAHTTWFFETFILGELLPGYRPFDPTFRMLFNSYYDAVGVRPLQARRGLMTRPSFDEVLAYRGAVDGAMRDLLGRTDSDVPGAEISARLALGLAHEEQHQELILTDGLALFAGHPLEPAWRKATKTPPNAGSLQPEWIGHQGGIVEIGRGSAGFAFDNEGPRHEVLLRPFRLAARPVSNGDWLEFMADGGYARPTLWQSDGWDQVKALGWSAPEYWRQQDGAWTAMTLFGRQLLDMAAPVCHVSWYEADAFATWAGARLPDEAEWEAMAADVPVSGNLLESGALRPLPAAEGGLAQMFGDVWEWTATPHRPYPGWRAPQGAFGEYNGKFMIGRMVCRGGSFATPAAHVRASYRNFWWPSARWQFTGLRLAEDA